MGIDGSVCGGCLPRDVARPTRPALRRERTVDVAAPLHHLAEPTDKTLSITHGQQQVSGK